MSNDQAPRRMAVYRGGAAQGAVAPAPTEAAPPPADTPPAAADSLTKAGAALPVLLFLVAAAGSAALSIEFLGRMMQG